MALLSVVPRPLRGARLPSCLARNYATVERVTLVGRAPGPPKSVMPPSIAATSILDAPILSELRRSRGATLPTVVQKYLDNAGKTLNTPLPYESRPNGARTVNFDDSDGVVMVAHAIQHGEAHKIALCSGFVLDVAGEPQGGEERTVVLTCAHTLEEMRNSSLFASLPALASTHEHGDTPLIASGSFVLTPRPGQHAPAFHPVNDVLSALHRPDLLLLSVPRTPVRPSRSLPVSPYPAHPGATIRAHVVIHREPDEEGWRPWTGGTWSKWVQGTILGYRDFAGREATPGTYDALTHMLFKPLPTPGSSGGPIIDEESGAVIGVMLGTQMDNRVEGLRGWGVPAETIFEMFNLPGMKLRQ